MAAEDERGAHIDQALDAIGGGDTEFYLDVRVGVTAADHAVRLTCRYQGCRWGEFVGEMELWEFVADARRHWEDSHAGNPSASPAPVQEDGTP